MDTSLEALMHVERSKHLTRKLYKQTKQLLLTMHSGRDVFHLCTRLLFTPPDGDLLLS